MTPYISINTTKAKVILTPSHKTLPYHNCHNIHIHRFNSHHQEEPGLDGCPLIFLFHFPRDCAPSWDRPNLFISSLIPSHYVKVKVKEHIVLREIHLRTTGRHLSMGSHSVICHPTSPQPGRLVLDLSTP